MLTTDLKEEETTNTEIQTVCANHVVILLPQLDPHPSDLSQTIKDRNEEMLRVEAILNPLLDSKPDDIPLALEHIDAMLTPDQYPFAGKFLYRSWERKHDPEDNHPTFSTPVGPISLNKFVAENGNKKGYNFHFSTTLENFNFVSNYLKWLYGNKNVYPNATYKRSKGADELTCTHIFNNGNYQDMVILHITPENFEENEVIQVDISNVPAPKEENENDLNMITDPQMEKERIDSFINTAATLLSLGDFKIEQNGKMIFGKEDLDDNFRNITSGLMKITFTGKENYSGIELLLGLLGARLRYPFNITSMEAITYDCTYKNRILKSFTEDQNLELIKQQPFGCLHFEKDGVSIKLRNEARGLRNGKGNMIWNIEVPREYFTNVITTILNFSEGELAQKDLFEAKVRVINPSGYAYYANIIPC